MARIRRPLDPHGQAAQVYQHLKREPAGWRRERLLAVKLGLEGELDLEDMAAHLGRARSCIQRWLDRFRRDGLDRLLQRPRRGKGPASQLTPELAEALRQKVAAGTFRRAADAHCWLVQEHGLRVGLATVYTYLKKSARGSKSRALAIKRRTSGPPKPSAKRWRCTWVADEMRYGLQPVTRRVWSLRGRRPVCPVHPRYQWAYLYGALEVGGQGHAEFLCCPTVNLDYSGRFLEQGGPRPRRHPRADLGWGRLSPGRRRGGPARQRTLVSLPGLQPGIKPGRKALSTNSRTACAMRSTPAWRPWKGR